MGMTEMMTSRNRTVTAVSVNGLEKAEGDPAVHGHDMQVSRQKAIYERSSDTAHSENGNFGRMSIFRGESKGCRIFVM